MSNNPKRDEEEDENDNEDDDDEFEGKVISYLYLAYICRACSLRFLSKQIRSIYTLRLQDW